MAYAIRMLLQRLASDMENHAAVVRKCRAQKWDRKGKDLGTHMVMVLAPKPDTK